MRGLHLGAGANRKMEAFPTDEFPSAKDDLPSDFPFWPVNAKYLWIVAIAKRAHFFSANSVLLHGIRSHVLAHTKKVVNAVDVPRDEMTVFSGSLGQLKVCPMQCHNARQVFRHTPKSG